MKTTIVICVIVGLVAGAAVFIGFRLVHYANVWAQAMSCSFPWPPFEGTSKGGACEEGCPPRSG